jgi:choline dehydrogenase-like flavoprotein
MRVENLRSLDAGTTLDTDLVIIGSGPAGLTIAREFFGTSTRVLILESGQREVNPQFANLNTVESVGEPKDETQARRRTELWGHVSSWSNQSQRYGLRCRVLGGSSHNWNGKSAPLEHIDFAARDWVPYSGWPIGLEILDPYIDRAAEVLNLGPNCYDNKFWDLLGIAAPQPQFDPSVLKSIFWQFARSRINSLDVMRFGPEFLTFEAPNVRVLLNATAIRIDTNDAGSAFDSLEVSTIDGVRTRIRAKAAVLAASAIENPRLLLVSNGNHPNGLGNQHDTVGRYLIDHPVALIGRFNTKDWPVILERFGFYSITRRGRRHLYMPGLALSKEVQERERLLHCAVYMSQKYSSDDPWDTLKRLLRGKSDRPIPDLLNVASSPGLVAKGLAIRAFESNAVPERVKHFIINTIIKQFPNFAVAEFLNRGLPHKLSDIIIEGITEQRPDPESRITLSDKSDALGVPIARINWRIDDEARRSLMRLGQLLATELPRSGLAAPLLEDWVAEGRPQDGLITDFGHTAGTTRMSDNPKLGVVDSNCQVHGVTGLYVAGASVFPTNGHTNPTLMILSLAIRLADRIKADLARRKPVVGGVSIGAEGLAEYSVSVIESHLGVEEETALRQLV